MSLCYDMQAMHVQCDAYCNVRAGLCVTHGTYDAASVVQEQVTNQVGRGSAAEAAAVDAARQRYLAEYARNQAAYEGYLAEGQWMQQQLQQRLPGLAEAAPQGMTTQQLYDSMQRALSPNDFQHLRRMVHNPSLRAHMLEAEGRAAGVEGVAQQQSGQQGGAGAGHEALGGGRGRGEEGVK